MSTTTDGKAQKMLFKIEDMVNQGPSFTLKCHAWATVSQVKKQLEKTLKVIHSNLRLFYKNIELTKNGGAMLDYDVKSHDTLTVKITPQLQNSIGVINPYRIFDTTPQPILATIEEIKSGFLKSLKPKLTENGTSGSYFLENHNLKNVAIFKPYDQQPFAPNNPRKYIGELGSQGFRKGILSGESAARQVAAYLLDQEGFHGVPPTTYIEFYHPSFIANENIDSGPIKSTRQFKLKNQTKTKHGSLQAFIPSDDTIGNYGANCFSIEQIHKIAILDVRILNCDRNDTNILVKKHNIQIQTQNGLKTKKQYKLTPIDHGLSLPDNFQIYDYQILWINFPQVLQPFTEKELKYIEAIDPIRDCEMLRERLEFRPICLRNFRIASILLKQAAKLGMTLYDIATIMYRKEPDSLSSDSDPESPRDHVNKISANLSELQKLVIEAENIYNVVKLNGLKSSVYYQIGIIQPRQTKKIKTKLEAIAQEQHEEQFKKHSMKQIELKTSFSKQEKYFKRSVSLPCLKFTSIELEDKDEKEPAGFSRQISCKKEYKPRKFKRGRKSQRDNDDQKEWEEIFFHYFEDVLCRFLKSKLEKQTRRSRFKSQCLS